MTDLPQKTQSDMNAFLRVGFANGGAEPAGPIDVFPLAGDASSRRYFRAVFGERSCVLMLWEPFVDDGNYPFLSVRDHFARHEVQVPSVVAKAPHLGMVLLEDLGDLTLERKFWESQSQEASLPFYKLAIDELIKMHYASTFDRSDSCVAFRIQFDVEKLLWEMNYGREHLLLKLCKAKLSEAESKAIDGVFLNVCERLHAEEKFIAHRDYHSRNAMIKHGRLRVIDFQDARLGPIQYDLVSLLRDSYVDLKESAAQNLIAYYLERRKDACDGHRTRPFSREQFDEIYELQTIQRCFKACGSFSSFYNLRGDKRYLKYIHRTLLTVKRSLARFPKYRPFFDALDSHGVFDESFSEIA